jgi:hypothetical protein
MAVESAPCPWAVQTDRKLFQTLFQRAVPMNRTQGASLRALRPALSLRVAE